MNKTLLAAALAAGAALAVPFVPGFAQNAAQPMPPAAAMPPMGGAPMMGGGPMQPMRHRMMMEMHPGNPQEGCIDRLAWRAARRAYIETRLDLTAAQRPLWDKLENIAQKEQQQERLICDSLKNAPAPTVVERMEHLQRFLAARLDGLRAAQPALEALYQALTPAQRTILDHPFHQS